MLGCKTLVAIGHQIPSMTTNVVPADQLVIGKQTKATYDEKV